MYSALTRVEAYSLSPCLLVTGDISALAGAPIQELNLYKCDKLTGTLAGRVSLKYMCCPKATPKRTFQKYSSFLFTPSLHHTTSGNIDVFKDMPITQLNLEYCSQLEGM